MILNIFLMNLKLQNLSEIHYCGYKLKMYVHMINIWLKVNLSIKEIKKTFLEEVQLRFLLTKISKILTCWVDKFRKMEITQSKPWMRKEWRLEKHFWIEEECEVKLKICINSSVQKLNSVGQNNQRLGPLEACK